MDLLPPIKIVMSFIAIRINTANTTRVLTSVQMGENARMRRLLFEWKSDWLGIAWGSHAF